MRETMNVHHNTICMQRPVDLYQFNGLAGSANLTGVVPLAQHHIKERWTSVL